MTLESEKGKTQFFIIWTGLIMAFVLLATTIAFIAISLANSALGHNTLETGTYLGETANYCAASLIIAAVIGLTQWQLLRRKLKSLHSGSLPVLEASLLVNR